MIRRFPGLRLPRLPGLPVSRLRRPRRPAALPSRRPSASLARDPNFRIFWAGQTFSVLGDAIALIALPLLVLEATDSVARMGQITAVHGLGALLAGLAAGPIVDRVDRRRLMIRCDLGRLVCSALIPVGWWLLPEPLWLLYALAFLGAGFGMIFGIAYVTAVANLVDRDRILDANGKLQTTFALAYVLGPMLAGLLVGAFGAGALGVTAVTYGISAVSLRFVRLRRAAAQRGGVARAEGGTAGERDGGTAGDGGVRQKRRRHRLGGGDWAAGFRFLATEPVFRALTLLMAAYAFLATGGLDLIIFHLKDDLGQGDTAVGVIFGLASGGAILAGILSTRLRRRWGFGPVFAVGFIVQGLTTLLIGLSGAVVVIVLVFLVYTFAETARGTTTMTLRQELTPDHLLGRVTAAFWIAFQVPGPLGAAALTAVAERAGAGATLAGIGVTGMLIGAAALVTPAGRRRPRLKLNPDDPADDGVPREVVGAGLVEHGGLPGHVGAAEWTG